MFGNKSNARWIAIMAVGVLMSSAVACMLLVFLLTSAYGGETIRLRNPFAQPTAIPYTANNPTNTDNTTNSTTNNPAPTTSSNTGSVTTSDSASAYLPTVSGYTRSSTMSIQGALDMVLAGANLSAQSDGTTFESQSLSLMAGSVLLTRVDEFTACLQRSGAVDAQVYIKADVTAILAGNVPAVGAIAVVNQDRLRDAAASCALDSVGAGMFSAQAAQPCGDLGSFTIGAVTYTYLYAATSQDFCTSVGNYYAGLG